MALTWPRFLFGFVIGAAIISSLIVRQRPSRAASAESRVYEALQNREWQATNRLGRTADRLRVLQLRDSIARAALGRAPQSRPYVEMDRSIPAVARPRFDSLAAKALTSRSARPRVPVTIAFVLDTISTVRGVPRTRTSDLLTAVYILPSESTRGTCLVLGLVRPMVELKWAWAHIASDETARRMRGPCAFYEEFGAPGPRIAEWLRHGGWSYGMQGTWNDTMPRWSDESYVPSYIREAGYPLRSRITSIGFRCVSGDLSSCESEFTRQGNRAYASRTWGSTIVESGGNRFFREEWGWFDRSLGPRDYALLSEMVRSLGPEKFRRFWTSDRSPTEAFQASAGVTLGTWLHGWMGRTYGTYHNGPGVTPTATIFALLVLTLACALGLRAAEHRYVA